MWWKVYFWIYFILTVIGFFFLTEYAPLSFADFIGIVLSVILVIATYSYVFKKKILEKKYWKFLFWFSITLLVLDFLILYFLPPDFIENHLPFLQNNIPLSPNDMLFSWIMSTPAVIAEYRLSKKNT